MRYADIELCNKV